MTDLQETFRRKFVKQRKGPVLVVGSKLFPSRPDWRTWHPNGVGVDMQSGDGVDIVAHTEVRSA